MTAALCSFGYNYISVQILCSIYQDSGKKPTATAVFSFYWLSRCCSDENSVFFAAWQVCNWIKLWHIYPFGIIRLRRWERLKQTQGASVGALPAEAWNIMRGTTNRNKCCTLWAESGLWRDAFLSGMVYTDILHLFSCQHALQASACPACFPCKETENRSWQHSIISSIACAFWCMVAAHALSRRLTILLSIETI